MSEIKAEVSDVKNEQSEIKQPQTSDVQAVEYANNKFAEIAKTIEDQSTLTEAEVAEALNELMSMVFDCDEEDFSFEDFDFEDPDLESLIDYFEANKWEKLSDYEKTLLCRSLGAYLADKLGVQPPPIVIPYKDVPTSCGSYNHATNVIKVNTALYNNPKETLDTIAHETWHAYQHKCAERNETLKDVLYAYNFDNYRRTSKDANGKTIGFDEYQSQLVEAEARAFANQIKEKVGY